MDSVDPLETSERALSQFARIHGCVADGSEGRPSDDRLRATFELSGRCLHLMNGYVYLLRGGWVEVAEVTARSIEDAVAVLEVVALSKTLGRAWLDGVWIRPQLARDVFGDWVGRFAPPEIRRELVGGRAKIFEQLSDAAHSNREGFSDFHLSEPGTWNYGPWESGESLAEESLDSLDELGGWLMRIALAWKLGLRDLVDWEGAERIANEIDARFSGETRDEGDT